MSTRRGAWISRRGQAGADAAIDQVIEYQPQSGEQIQQVPDELIADSPYQVRQPISDDNVEELAQGMRVAGFQGVLIVRPHSEPAQRRGGMLQLVYGHRRRAAWRRVCVEQGAPCAVPVIVRAVSDEQMLLIGAQENLQRQDLDPLEEGQLVDWHERMFADKNQAEIGALLGKSSDWVSTRARIHKLPDTLKERLRLRPRASSQLLELGVLYAQQPAAALELADRVVSEHLTLDALRVLLRGYARPERRETTPEPTARRGAAASVQEITDRIPDVLPSSAREALHERRNTATQEQAKTVSDQHSPASLPVNEPILPAEQRFAIGDLPGATDIALLQEAAAALAAVASRAGGLPRSVMTTQAIDQIEQAIVSVRRALVRRALPEGEPPQRRSYRLIDTGLEDVLTLLHDRHPAIATICGVQGAPLSLHLIMCLLPKGSASRGLLATDTCDLFVAVADAGHGTMSLLDEAPGDWVQHHLSLAQDKAVIVAAFISDLGRGLVMRSSSRHCSG